MAYTVRKPFTYQGEKHVPGDVLESIPDGFYKTSTLVRTGFIVETPDEVEEDPGEDEATKVPGDDQEPQQGLSETPGDPGDDGSGEAAEEPASPVKKVVKKVAAKRKPKAQVEVETKE